ncbi:hypothetical protein CCHR01_02140 [Colletotrichum chrysophilum]|uniref:SnoaL-like domain-containing protein n=1 Tax=Colletotrichum chrysophilum TaxID=1836956 RepID=A0AAD9AWB9_9PEZI|nr:hypothetical protein CCHR01_02140 [Colletotrichum chrysophilum]
MSTENEYDRADFDVYVAELAGSSHDRAMRPGIEQMVRQFFRATSGTKIDVDVAMSFFSDNPTAIEALKGLGEIYIGAAMLKKWIESWGEERAQTVQNIVVVDRGHVTCHVVTFIFDDENPEIFNEYHGVIIMDLDKGNRIERYESRATTREAKEHKGGIKRFDALVEEAEEDAITVDCLS